MKQRLLKRISLWEQSSLGDSEDHDTNDLVESIRDDLEKIFNTKRGTVLIDDNFGLPDFSHMLSGYASPDIGFIMQQLHLQAKYYEPRLRALHINHVEQNKFPGKLQFQITAKLDAKEQELPFNVNALLSDDGSVSLSA